MSTRVPGEILTFARIRPAARGTAECDDDARSVSYNIHPAAGGAGSEETLEMIIPEGHRNTVGNKERARYKFTRVLEGYVAQQDVFQAVALNTVSASLRGYSGAIFAFGQTSSGKTWTVTGGEGFEERGLAPRSIGQLFREIADAEASTASINYQVRASYLEIYEERVYDLLDVSNRDKTVEEWATASLLTDSEGNQFVKGLTTFEVDSKEDALNLFFMGNSHRVMGETPTNQASSRSHAVFTLSISSEREEGAEGRRLENDSEPRTIKTECELNLIDLAGSERMYKNDRHGYSAGLDDTATLELLEGTSGAVRAQAVQRARKAAREREGKSINLSLHTLEKVVHALKNPGMHVPYRESALTSVLRKSLRESCRAVFVVNLSMDVEDLAETVAACRFAQRCSKVLCRPTADERLEPSQEIDLLKRETAEMRASLKAKDDILRVLTKEIQDREEDLEASVKRLKEIEAAHVFHTERELNEEDKEACAVIAEALMHGSDEAEEALEALDRVSVLQCCRELQRLFSCAPLPPPPLPVFSADAAVAAHFEDGEFEREEDEDDMREGEGDEGKYDVEEEEGDREAGEEQREQLDARNETDNEEVRQQLEASRAENAKILAELARLRDQAEALKALQNELRELKSTEGQSLQEAEPQNVPYTLAKHSERVGNACGITDLTDSTATVVGEAHDAFTPRDSTLVYSSEPSARRRNVYDDLVSPDINGGRESTNSHDNGTDCNNLHAPKEEEEAEEEKEEKVDPLRHSETSQHAQSTEASTPLDTPKSSGAREQVAVVGYCVKYPGASARVSVSHETCSSSCGRRSSTSGARVSDASLLQHSSSPASNGTRESAGGTFVNRAASYRATSPYVSAGCENKDVSAGSSDEFPSDVEEERLIPEATIEALTTSGVPYIAEVVGPHQCDVLESDDDSGDRATSEVEGKLKEHVDGESDGERMGEATMIEIDDTTTARLNLRQEDERNFGPRYAQPPPLRPIYDGNDIDAADLPDRRRYIGPVSGRASARGGEEEGGSEELGKFLVSNATENYCARLTRGDFFVKHSRFGKPHMRFVWMSQDLGTIMWRCCGREEVKKSTPTASFDTVHLGCAQGTPSPASSSSSATSASTTARRTSGGTSRSVRTRRIVTRPAPRATSAAAAAAATAAAVVASAIPLTIFSLARAGARGNASKQIVLSGGAGRHCLVLELDSGKTTPEEELRQRDEWFLAFKYAVDLANVQIVSKMARAAGRHSISSPRPLWDQAAPAENPMSRSRSLSESWVSSADALIDKTTDSLTSRGRRSHPIELPATSALESNGGGSRGDGGWAAASNVSLTITRPPAIDTTGRSGAFGPSSPPAKGRSRSSPTRTGRNNDRSSARDEGGWKASAISRLADTAKSVTARTFRFTSPSSRGAEWVPRDTHDRREKNKRAMPIRHRPSIVTAVHPAADGIVSPSARGRLGDPRLAGVNRTRTDDREGTGSNGLLPPTAPLGHARYRPAAIDADLVSNVSSPPSHYLADGVASGDGNATFGVDRTASVRAVIRRAAAAAAAAVENSSGDERSSQITPGSPGARKGGDEPARATMRINARQWSAMRAAIVNTGHSGNIPRLGRARIGSPRATGQGSPPPPPSRTYTQSRRMSSQTNSAAHRGSAQHLAKWIVNGAADVKGSVSSTFAPSLGSLGSPGARDVDFVSSVACSGDLIAPSAAGYSPASVIGSPQARGGVTMV